jgi:hypothetical protein
MKADQADSEPEATPERASVSSDRRAQGSASLTWIASMGHFEA